jgi:hypothetical protein
MATGDIFINWKGIQNGIVGHAGVGTQAGIWEATNTSGLRETKDGYWSGASKYEPIGMSAAMQSHLYAWMGILEGAAYSIQRAVCSIGNKSFGAHADSRIAKYLKRAAQGQSGRALVPDVFCSEAVVLVYQLAFYDTRMSADTFFISLDAKHTMPRDLEAFLKAHPARWEYSVVP